MVVSNNKNKKMYELFVAFLSTHLAMVTYLMPWKKIITASGEHVLYTLWDANNIETWVNTDLPSSVHTIIGLTTAVLAVSVLTYILRQFYAALNPDIYSVLDLTNWGLILGVLVVTLTCQADFDTEFALKYPGGDTNKLFLTIAIISVHLLLITLFVAKDLYERMQRL